MFQNEITTEGHPNCPLCTGAVLPNQDTWTEGQKGELVQTPTGLWIIHKSCVQKWNNRAALIQELEGKVND
jgi:hypothetical protein